KRAALRNCGAAQDLFRIRLLEVLHLTEFGIWNLGFGIRTPNSKFQIPDSKFQREGIRPPDPLAGSYCGPHAAAGGVTSRNGLVSRSIDLRNRTSWRRSRGSVSVSRRSARPAVRCVTFSSTAASVGAAPLCR